jgi:preprotein translocase subunit YajC
MIVIVYLVVLVALFFVLIVRPQRRQSAAHRALVQSIEVGNEVITSGGIFGTVRAVEDDVLEVEVANGVVVKVARAAIAQLVAVPGDNDAANGEAA